MARTTRQPARRKAAQKRKAQDEFYRQVTIPATTQQPAPGEIVQAKKEVEAVLNSKARTVTASIQAPPTDDPAASMAGGLLWWTGCTLDQFIPLSEYGDPKRQRDLQVFALIAPLALIASATMIKKAQSLQWTLDGGRNLVNKWHKRLLNLESNRGWDFFITRLVRSYLESDNGGIGEIVRAAPTWAVDENNQLTDRGSAAIKRGADAAWEIVDIRVFDPVQLRATRSQEFPMIYNNPWTGRRHNLRDYNFIQLLDMASVDHRLFGTGTCALSRAVWTAQEDRMIIRYAMEKMSENPGAGIVFANASDMMMKTALKSAQTERDGRGVIFYKGLIFIPVLNPEGTFSAEFINFSGLPDGFDRSGVYNILKEITATAYGLDVLDLGTLAGAGALGTGAQATVMASKSAGKGIGVIMQGIEREFRFKLLPEALEFRFEKQEAEERQQEAKIHQILFTNAKMYFDITGDSALSQQYLVDTKAIPPEYVPEDITPDIVRDDTEAQEKMKRLVGPRVRKWRDGRMAATGYAHMHVEKQIERLRPKPGKEIPTLEVDITEQNIERANAAFDTLFPNLQGLLEARRVR